MSLWIIHFLAQFKFFICGSWFSLLCPSQIETETKVPWGWQLYSPSALQVPLVTRPENTHVEQYFAKGKGGKTQVYMLIFPGWLWWYSIFPSFKQVICSCTALYGHAAVTCSKNSLVLQLVIRRSLCQTVYTANPYVYIKWKVTYLKVIHNN